MVFLLISINSTRLVGSIETPALQESYHTFYRVTGQKAPNAAHSGRPGTLVGH